MNKPYAESCEQNRAPILSVLLELLTEPVTLLEIGSGTGQHAVYFAPELPHVCWQPSDRAEYIPGILLWLKEAELPNITPPLVLDVSEPDWPVDSVGAVFSANTVHIMGYPDVERMFAGVGRVLMEGGYFCLYGPFNYGGEFTSDSNARFDAWLKQRDPGSGIRNFEGLDALAQQAGMELYRDYEMPANNRILVWKKAVTRY